MDRMPQELLRLVGRHIEQFPRYHKVLSTRLFAVGNTTMFFNVYFTATSPVTH